MPCDEVTIQARTFYSDINMGVEHWSPAREALGSICGFGLQLQPWGTSALLGRGRCSAVTGFAVSTYSHYASLQDAPYIVDAGLGRGMN